MGDGNSASARLRTMDFAKGFVIAAIVMIHVIMLRGDGGPRGHEMISNPVTSALYLGLMLFFIVSGYFYKPGRTPLENIKHRLPPMFIAFAVSLVVLPILMYLYLTAIGCNPDPAGILNSFKVIIGPVTVGEPHGTEFVHYEVYCFAGSYYINVLMGQSVILYTVMPYIYGDVKRSVAAIAVMVSATAAIVALSPINLPLYIELVPIATAFMVLGTLLQKYRIVEWMETDGLHDKRFWLSLVLSMAAGLCLVAVLNPSTDFDRMYFGEYGWVSTFPYFLEASLMCYSFLCLFSLLQRVGPATRLFGTIGKHTLAILLYHTFFLKLMIAPFYEFTEWWWFPKDLPIAGAVAAGIVQIAVITVLATYQKEMIGRLLRPFRKRPMGQGAR